MKTPNAVQKTIDEQERSGKPLAIILAGHNGSGKSTMWYKHLADNLQVPLINADRMMLSILPEHPLPSWAVNLRDKNDVWMGVAQNGVKAFVAHAMAQGVPFAMETVFSHWVEKPDGAIESKIDTIRELQGAGYFVLLIFVGLANFNLSMARVASRKSSGGHDVDRKKLKKRFPRTQMAIRAALPVADASILVDNSRNPSHAFEVVRVQLREHPIYDIRNNAQPTSPLISEWMQHVCGPVEPEST